MRYELGTMDIYPFLANKTCIENNPFLQVVLNEPIDDKQLYKAINEVLEDYPLFKCTICINKGFYLETNTLPVRLICASEEHRPLSFGDATNGYLWQLCYDKNTLTFEWAHGLTDGRGGYAFFISLLHRYFEVNDKVDMHLELGLESIYDKNEKGLGQKKQEKGFKAKYVPYQSKGYQTTCHILKAPMKELLEVSKKNDASPAAVIPPLFSQVLSRHINSSSKNRNVTCNIVIDCRGPMSIQTMHNCIIPKNITYIPRYDTMDFALVSTIYRAILDLAVQRENIIVEATKTVDIITPLVAIKPRVLQKGVAQIVAKIMKNQDSHFTFTYLGKVVLPDVILAHIQDFNFRSWTDIGQCNIAALDLNGTLIMNICENYKDKLVISDFIDQCKQVGIHFEKRDTFAFTQASLRMKKL